MTVPADPSVGAFADNGLPDDSAPAAGGAAPMHAAALLKAIVEAVGDAVVVTSAELDDPGPRIEYVNAGLTRMTGYQADEVVGRTPRMLQGPKTDRTTLDHLRAALEQGQSYLGTSVNYRKDGTEFVNEWLIVPFHDDQGRTVRWISTQRDVSERVRAETSQRLLLEELDHRVMNNLAAVQSLASRIGRTSASIQAFRDALHQRLFALAEAQRAIASAHWHSVPLYALAQAQLAPFDVGRPGRVNAAGSDIRLRSGAAVVLGLALHELGLNALRHGCLSAPNGRVELGWSVVPEVGGDELCVEWVETGGRLVTPPVHRGFGLRLLEEVLAREIGGTVQMLFDASGIRCLIAAPLAGIVERRV